jgi:two-component SAPR family response regulator
LRILIVEDEALVALSLEGMLQDAGHTVIGPALTSAAAMRIIKDECPDLALVNINLKEERGAGIEVARYLLEYCGVPSIFVSGQILEARENRDVALGYINKPYNKNTLLRSVEIARQIICGEEKNITPNGLELFVDSNEPIKKK